MFKGDSTPAVPAPAAVRAGSRAWLLGAASLWLLVTTGLGVTQDLRPDPLAAPAFMSLDWWRYPLERHAPLRLPIIGGELRGLHVGASGRDLWVVGDAGLVLHSSDGGSTWSPSRLGGQSPAQEAPAPAPAREPAKAALSFSLVSDANAGDLPALPSKQPNSKRDSGLPAEPQARDPAAAPRKDTSPAVPPDGTAPVTATPAQTPAQPMQQALEPEPPRPADLHAVVFDAAGRNGMIGASDGTLYGSADAGRTWQVQTRFDAAVLALASLADGRQLAITRAGVLYQFDAAQSSWRVRAQVGPLADAAIDSASGRVLALTLIGRLADSPNGGASWTEADAPMQGRGRILNLSEKGEVWSAGPGSWMQRTQGLPYALGAPAGVAVLDVRLNAVRRASGREFAVGESGSIYTRATIFEPWRPLSAGRAGALREIRIAPGGEGSALGLGSIRFVTQDAGATWQAQGAQHRRFAAPWLWLAWLLGLAALVMVALRRPPAGAGAVTETAADAFVSDKPLAAAREDRLDFAPLAWGLSAFLRNEKTDAPLTIAITGDWGSGKSSLMGLLKEDLARFGVRSVWFNAWHHQKEEALLMALLTAIRDQAIPGWCSFEGIEYRLRLMWTRGRRYWPLSLAVAFSVGLFGWTFSHPGTVLDNWLTLANDLWSALTDDKAKPDPDSLIARLRATGLAAGAMVPLIGALLRMRAFGVDPAALAASLSSHASVKDLGSQASFRQRFAEQFSEVTAALEPRTMLVLIDDLDRCKPEAVLEVMEAVNFLVSSGRVYVVLGMARARVEACVGLAFEKVAHELVEAESAKAVAEMAGEDKDARARRIRREYAQQYLEKLINIEVPVPRLDPNRSAHLQDEAGETGSSFEVPMAVRRICRLWPALVGVVTIVAGAWLGAHLPAAVERGPAQVAASAGTATQQALVFAQPELPTAGPAVADAPSAGLVFFAPAVPLRTDYLTPALLLSASIVIIVLATVRRPSPVVRDSPAFRDALAIWNPVVATALRTPRAVKRYQNRVRYLAMMARHSTRASTLGEEVRMWLMRRGAALPAVTAGDPSPELVAIGALDRALPGWDACADFAAVLEKLESPALRDAIAQALRAHAGRFDLAAVKDFVPSFRRLASGVRMEPNAQPGADRDLRSAAAEGRMSYI
ncbi:P-loop NTPase fold protein [Niveibacterium sp. 24ML]|uniref:P-loop NTPase fold protein n=1 Tax=Niveibacterium sp. 24ML TaxID=2985512 RepID=UPI00226F936F|nr:P-loop NTPase fold protein [Niveibacterium sp. 24ML]MCX9155482.1 P-loop NTPase fold protein [Niveibacterium sp. 24ML]